MIYLEVKCKQCGEVEEVPVDIAPIGYPTPANERKVKQVLNQHGYDQEHPVCEVCRDKQ